MEAANILLLPGAALLFAPPQHVAEMFSMGLAIGACAGFLLVGALFWWGLDQRLKLRNGRPLTNALVVADRLEVPLLFLSGAATVSLIWALGERGFTWPLAAAAVLNLLAVLEYANYYHRQIQHFDRWSDFKRLVTTRRLRRSHMSRALEAHRKSSALATERRSQL
jgi:hypothetical protein